MKIKYRDQNFNAATLGVIAKMNEILAESIRDLET